ncbi:MAG: hypothetical protein VX777_08715 [Chlamydiota bacterium]|nr:hypothetical protein [Chlamydiota bacterium]
MVKKLFFLIFIFTVYCKPSIAGDDALYELDADIINYSGNRVELEGNVAFQYDLAKISSHSAFLEQKTSGKEKKTARLGFCDDVTITMKDRGVIHCISGEADLSKNKISLQGEPVHYQKEVAVSCKDMVLRYDESHTITEIVATGHVFIEDPHQYRARGHQAIYNGEGLVTLLPKKNERCFIDTPYGVNIEAEEVIFDTLNHQILLKHTQGSIRLVKGLPTAIEADLAVWDETDGVLTLLGNAIVSHPLMASIKNTGLISFIWNDSDLQYMTVMGDSKITCFNKQGGVDYHLTVNGNIVLDHTLKQLYIEKMENQIQYSDKLGHVFGDTLIVDYKINNKEIEPSKVQLSNNVKLLSIASVSTSIDSFTPQYALADTMQYFPDTKVLHLSGQNGGRVLYYDKINNVQISAPKLLYSKNAKETVKGIGDVRFRFMEQELNEIKKRFKFDG